MNYNNVIPFDAREQASVRHSGRGCAVLSSTTTTPTIKHPELQSTATLTNETPAEEADVLFEQLGYLIQFADQERNRLDRVKAILLETFN